MLCPDCGFENPAGVKFCGECGISLRPICPDCQTESPPGFKFCGECGASLVKGGERKVVETSPAAERRQLTVMFCDLVGSTSLSGRLDPEELREILHDYQSVCAKVIGRYEGYIARYFGDGILVYFGYPVAHEDDARRAVHTGLGILEAIAQLNSRLEEEKATRLQVRLGIHTGVVVAGDIGQDEQLESMAIIGETPNIAARLEHMAEPDTLVTSSATRRLVEGSFEVRDLGDQLLKGIPTPVKVYQVLGERVEAPSPKGVVPAEMTPLVGREREVTQLLERWEQARSGAGQVVLIDGEAGIGKSRLVRSVKEYVANEAHVQQEYRCSPYHRNSALYPVINLLERWLGFEREDSPEDKLDCLEDALAGYSFSLGEAVPLLASLLSIPLDGRYAPLNLAPQRQREQTLDILLYLLLETANQQPMLAIFEDLHWADPSTLDFLDLVVDQVPTAPILALVTYRPILIPSWSERSFLSQMTLGNLPAEQTEAIVGSITGGKALPAEVQEQLVSRTDGVPLFVEELTKMVLESGLLQEREDRFELTGPLPPLAIPATLRDSLTARLDRLATTKEVAQLGATLGREFSYKLLNLVSAQDEATLQDELARLVEAQLLYQRGLPPQAKYIFKHALIQEAAYRSLLRSKRQQVHQQVARVLAEQIPETAEIQPELIAHHYTEAGLAEEAIPYWLWAGQMAGRRSANAEAISHLKKGLELLEAVPSSPERVQQELALQTALGNALLVTKGYAAPEVGDTYARARELCREVGETPQLYPVLYGLSVYYLVRAEHQTARELALEHLDMARRQGHPSAVVAHRIVAWTSLSLGELTLARKHAERIAALYNREQHQALAFQYGQDPGVSGLSFGALVLWLLGYPRQALDSAQEAVALARNVSHPHTLAFALTFAAVLHHYRREARASQKYADEAIAVSDEHGFALWRAWSTPLSGWVLAERGQLEEGVAKIHEGLSATRATGTAIFRPYDLTHLAAAHGKAGQIAEGLGALAEALAVVEESGERYWEAEIYRLKGELLLRAQAGSSTASEDEGVEGEVIASSPESCFLKAVEIARQQEARSLELRATVSLSRLWASQGRREEARQMLGEIYDWFSEGFDTVDLKEARAQLDTLSEN